MRLVKSRKAVFLIGSVIRNEFCRGISASVNSVDQSYNNV